MSSPHLERPVADRTLRHRFERAAGRFAEVHARLARHPGGAFVRDDWADRNRQLAASLLPQPDADLLHHAAIRDQMAVPPRFLEAELPVVRPQVADADLAEEPLLTPPHVTELDDGVRTSPNRVHHLHHLLRHEQATGCAPDGVDSVLEWGAGYGSLARCLLRRHGGRPTVVLVDTPLFGAVQWLYLSTLLGDEVVVVDDPAVEVRAGQVNVVPVGLVPHLDLRVDLFVSTWALNESSQAAQRYVLGRDLFGAEHVLMAMHDTDPLVDRLADHHLDVASVPVGGFLPHQRYYVR